MSLRPHSLLLSALAIVAALSPSIARAQVQGTPPPSSLSVDAVVSDVVGHNPELKFYEAELTAARADQKVAGRLPNPEFTPAVAQKRTTDPLNGMAGAGVAWTVALSQPFEWPGRMSLRKSIASRQVALAENGLDQFRNALAARARTLAYDLSVALQKAAVADEIAGRFLALQQVVVQRDPAGPTPLLESRILEANSITYRRRAGQARQQAREVLLELNQLRGKPLASDLQVVAGPIVFRPMMSEGVLMGLALTNNFELRQRVLELEQQGFKVDLAKTDQFPGLTLTPYFTQENSLGQDRFIGVGFALPLPLWNSGKVDVTIANARETQVQTALLLARRTVERRVAELSVAYGTRQEEMSRWRPDSVERFLETAELADRHYRLGAVAIATYVEMQKQALDALDALLDTRREALAAALDLELTTGTPLHLVSFETESAKP